MTDLIFVFYATRASESQLLVMNNTILRFGEALRMLLIYFLRFLPCCFQTQHAPLCRLTLPHAAKLRH